MHKLKIESLGVPYAKVLIDGKPMKATKIDVHISRDCVPESEITLLCEPDMEIESLVTFDYTPRTVTGAAKLLEAALLKNDITAFLAMHSLNKVVGEVENKK